MEAVGDAGPKVEVSITAEQLDLELVFPLGLGVSELSSLEWRPGEKALLFSSITQLQAHRWYTFPERHIGRHVAVHPYTHTVTHTCRPVCKHPHAPTLTCLAVQTQNCMHPFVPGWGLE